MVNSNQKKPSEMSSKLPNHEALTRAFVNVDLMKADHKHQVEKRQADGVVEDSSNDQNESLLEKNLRVSTTSPRDLALKDSSIARVDFETNDPVGNALKCGLPKDLDEVVLSRQEIQQLQRKLDKKQKIELDNLYAQLLRCPADEHLERYMPRTEQTPKPSRIHLELRETVAKKTADATKEAHREVFGKYCVNGELEHIIERFDQITAQCLADTKIVSKKQADALEVTEAAGKARNGLDGRLPKLAREDPDSEVLNSLGEKIKDARAKMLAAQHDEKQKKKAEKAEQRQLHLEKLSAKATGKTDQSAEKQQPNGIPKGSN